MEQKLVDLQLVELVSNAIITAITTIGIVQFLKNFLPRNSSSWVYAACSLYFCALSAFIIVMIDGIWAVLYNCTFLALAFTQLCYEAFVQGLPKFVNSIFNRASKNIEDVKEVAEDVIGGEK